MAASKCTPIYEHTDCFLIWFWKAGLEDILCRRVYDYARSYMLPLEEFFFPKKRSTSGSLKIKDSSSLRRSWILILDVMRNKGSERTQGSNPSSIMPSLITDLLSTNGPNKVPSTDICLPIILWSQLSNSLQMVFTHEIHLILRSSLDCPRWSLIALHFTPSKNTTPLYWYDFEFYSTDSSPCNPLTIPPSGEISEN